MPNVVSVVTAVAELAHGEKSCIQSNNHSPTHPAYLMPQEPKLLLRNNNNTVFIQRPRRSTKIQSSWFNQMCD